ncbi:RTA1 like protein-domain-containing protein [Mycena pura]|uniref:RTA1 like protein-domain-containing protein n=1 Tax=Mycena pura TaxID=153505 RepID=A0AAD6UXS9_9AGAR|nr:RTA1 like protein-domain-containing protein [Mycena pura]
MDVEDSQYGYLPKEYVAIIFLVLFSTSLILHIGQATYYRMWWLLPTACLCGLGEVVGWSGRLWSSFSPSLFDPYLMQICCTVISPTPLIAVNFILLSWVVTRLGPCYARLTPIQYTMVFVACDIVALIVQGAGGGIASTAATLDGANMGAHIMLGGIVFQFCAIVVYSVLAADLLYSYSTDRPRRAEPCAARGAMDGQLRTMICALALSTLVLFIRGIYRIVELSGGWSGRVLHTEVYFNVLDGGMVVLAMFAINFAHPGRLLGTRRPASPVGYEAKVGRGW